MYTISYETQAESDLLEILMHYAEQGGLELAEKISTRIQHHLNHSPLPYPARFN